VRLALNELHDDVGVLVRLAGLVHTNDNAVRQQTDGLRFVLEPGKRVGRLGIVGIEQAHRLDGYAAADNRIPPIIDVPTAPRPSTPTI
jgi:hypothetical protein